MEDSHAAPPQESRQIMPGSDTRTRDTSSLLGESLAIPAPLQIRLFGAVEVRVGGEPMPRLRTRKGLWLLALLALYGGRGVERDWVAGTLWPDSDEVAARRSLRQSLHDLRAALGPEAERLGAGEPRTLRFDLSGADCDVAAFDAAIVRGDPASLAEAAALYRGPFLVGCLEEWTLPERESRTRAVLSVLEALAAEARVKNDLPAAAACLGRALEIDPLRETSLRTLLETLALQGRHAAAIETYHAFRRRLRDELNAVPDTETIGLYRRLQAEGRQSPQQRPGRSDRGPVPASLGPAQLPAPLTTLIGRGREVDTVTAYLDGARLVTLTGTGGVGKTRLAVAVARKLLDEFSGGAWFADLAPLTDPQLLVQAVLAAFGGQEQPDRSPTEVLAELLRPRHVLLILDNCEHMVSDCARLAQTLLETCPALHILATSRETLGVPGELAWRVPSLSLPDGKADDADAEAVRLFVERARKVMPDWTPSPPEYATVAAICRRLDGIPLAIELAAARVRSLSVKEIGARLGEDFGLLSGGGRTLLPRQQTLAATFDWGWQLLSAGERTLLSRLSVFAGGWTLEMAEVACSDGDSLHIDEFVDLLTVLVDKSLVVYHPSREGVEGRYCLLETVRQYADERLRESGCGKASRERHRDTFLAWAEEIEPNLWREEQSRWFHRLETEHDNLRAALEWCRSQGDTEEEIRLVAVLGRFWNTCGHLREGRARLDAALSRMTPQMRYRPCFTALLHAGWTAYSLYDYPAARGYYEQALALCREYGERKAMAAPLNYLAALAKGDEDYRSAEMLYEEALVICREFDSQSQLAAVLNNLAGLVARRKDYVAARTLLEESISCSIAAGTPQMHGLGLDSLSIIDFHQGRHEEAQAHCRASLRLFHEAGALVNIPGVLGHMALLAQVQACPESERAAVLLGAAAGLRDAEGVVQEHAREDRDLVAETKAALGADAFSAAFAVGLAMGLEQILDYALG